MKYDGIIDLMLSSEQISYNGFYIRKDLERDPNFSEHDRRLVESIKNAKAKGANIHQQLQDAGEEQGMISDFRYVSVNRRFDEGKTKFRLYLSPKQANTHGFVIELVNRSLAQKSDIYFKYAMTSERLDQIIIYLKDENDINKKIALLKKLKEEKPELFEGMKTSKIWINEIAELPNVFLEPEPMLRNSIGRKSSYGEMIEKALSSTKSILEYGYRVGEKENLASKRSDSYFYSNFEQIFTEMLKRCGIHMQWSDETNCYVRHSKPINPNDLRVLFKFTYDKKSQIITETIGGGLYGEKEIKNSHSQQEKEREDFFKELIPDEQGVESPESSGR